MYVVLLYIFVFVLICRRKEAWRFVSYMFLHGSYEHIIFNCLMQLLVGKVAYHRLPMFCAIVCLIQFSSGIPIEMSQLGWVGSLRVAVLYFAGVILGALGATVSEPK